MQHGPIKQPRRSRLTPLAIAFVYAAIGITWIFFSDRLLTFFVSDIQQITAFAILKGSLYVLFTAVLLYFLIKRFTRSLSESEANYRMLMEQAGDGIFLVDDGGNILEVNNEACSMLGYSDNDLLKLSWKDIIDPVESGQSPLMVHELQNGHALFSRWNLRRRNGSVFPAGISGKKLPDGRILAIARDITEIKLREGLILRRNHQLQIVSSAIQRINTVLEIPAIIRSLVNSAMELTGAEGGTAGIMVDSELVFPEYHTKEEIIPVQNRFLAGSGVPGIVMSTKQPYVKNAAEHDGHLISEIRKNQEYYNLANIPILGRSGEFLGCFEIHNTAERRPFDEYDITMLQGLAAGAAIAIENTRMLDEQNKLQAQLRHSQKLEAIGVLAGGIAHDFNNILTAITGYGDMVLLKLPDHDLVRMYVTQILAASERAASLVRGLLAFSRKQAINPNPVDINNIIRNVVSLLARIIGEDIDLAVELAECKLTVMADPGQIEQVLMNLATNARDAMAEGGTLTIRTEKIRVTATDHERALPGEYARITVLDTGIGMDKETQERIFEPFFTTKEVGKGTGLGLAMVYGIISQHDGWITVTSEPGKGSVFTACLPLLSVPAEAQRPSVDMPLQRGSETVLLAEDSEEVRALIKAVLEDAGYTVLDAADGDEAIRIFSEQKNAVRLLILDVIMPKRGGKECYEHIKTLAPSIKSLFISGYTADVLQTKLMFGDGLQLVQKPVSPQELLRKVREVLDSGQS